MKKRLIALLTVLVIAAVCVIPAALAEDDTPDPTAGYYYVYTENGKGLNVRDTPGGTVVGSLKYGTKIYCEYFDGGNGWALITYKYDKPGYGVNEYACFISNRYLRKTKPPARPKENTSTSGTASSDDVATEINAEFRSAQKVEPFVVTVRPSRASGWVNVRWAPSKAAEIQATYKQNDKLLVIRELKNWYQVQDQDTGDVGFVSKQFVAQ